MITRESIVECYVFLKETRPDIPQETLELIKDAALSAYLKQTNACKNCQHFPYQVAYPSACTGCLTYGRRNFKLKGEI